MMPDSAFAAFSFFRRVSRSASGRFLRDASDHWFRSESLRLFLGAFRRGAFCLGAFRRDSTSVATKGCGLIERRCKAACALFALSMSVGVSARVIGPDAPAAGTSAARGTGAAARTASAASASFQAAASASSIKKVSERAARETLHRASDKASAMQSAKEAADALNLRDYLSESVAAGSVPEFGADVSELTALFGKGQGDLLSPGVVKADGCLEKGSMDCRAVQVIYETHQRGAWDESEFEGALADRDNLLNRLPGLPPSSETVCETITVQVPPQTDFAICEESAGGSTQTCIDGWIEKLDVSSLFECVARTGEKVRVTCLADYVSSTQNYTCLHAPLQTCSQGEIVRVDHRYRYQCETQIFKQNTYRCNRVLQIEGYAGCETGSLHEASSDVSAFLGQDACNGGDVIELKYTCSDDAVPLLQIETNVKNAANFTFQIQAQEFKTERTFSNCKGVWSGKTVCSGPNCTSEITMDIYVNPKNWTYSGSIAKKFAFQKASLEGMREKWTETCVTPDGSVIEVVP